MVTKLKVKDLAVELGIDHKDILQYLREMDIQVKSFMSPLEDEEVERVRQAFKGAQTEKSEVVRREVQPGVIVRRRRKRPGAKPALKVQAQQPESAPRTEQTPAAGETAAKTLAAKPVPAEASASAAAGSKPAETPKAEISAAKAPEAKAPVAKPPKTETPARIIREPNAEVPAARIITPAAAPEQASAEKSSKPQAAAAAPTAETETPKAEAAMPKAEAKTPPEAKPVTTEAVRRPSEAASPAPKAPAQEAAPKEEKAAPTTEAAAAPAEPSKPREAKPAAETEDKRRRKPRREVYVPSKPQVRIISRPEPGSIPPRPRRPEYSASGQGGARPYTPRTGQGGYQGRPSDRTERPSRPAGTGGYGRPRPGAAPAAPGRPGAEEHPHRRDRRVVNFGGEDERRRATSRRRRNNFTPAPVVSEDGDAPMRLKSMHHKKRHQEAMNAEAQKPIVGKRKIRINESIRLSELAQQMGVKAQAIIKLLFGMGMMATINQSLDLDTATLVAQEFGHEVENASFDEHEYLEDSVPDSSENMKPRPPVVTIMGHVDHGKTSLLDAIRKSSVAAGEAGGITQHIGAYHVSTSRGEIVFLDTPGHEAFTAMRARGAQVTDIVVLVVAADDGVMDQTREAINHARAAKVPIVVAINKIDKPGADPDRVKRELAEYELVPEEWGGQTIFANVSAKKRIGIDELLEMILLQAEVLELKANPDKPARGHIIEAKLDKGRGPIGTLLIQEGTLKPGDAFVCGTVHGKVRAMFNDQGRKIKSAGPSLPVEIQGFDVVPEAGDEFIVVADDKVARKIAQTRQAKQREKDMAGRTVVTLESFLKAGEEQEAKVLNLVLKADVQGSLEAITEALNKLSTKEVKIQIVHGATGGLTESDVMLAAASKAIIIGFNVRPTAKIKTVAEREHVEIRFYDIIYKLVSEIKDAMSGMLAPEIKEAYLGQAEVRNLFSVPKVGTVAGCAVVDGKLTRTAKVRLLREGVVVYSGQMGSLKRFKDDAREVMKGYECGVGLDNFNDIKIGDVIEAFEIKEVARTID